MKDHRPSVLRQKPQPVVQTRREPADPVQTPSGPAAANFGHTLDAIAFHSLPAPAPQAKLTVNEPGDIYEQEADQVASEVLRMEEDEVQTKRAGAGVQRECAACAEEQEMMAEATPPEEEMAQAKEEPGQTPEVSDDTQAAIDGMQGGGAPLDANTRDYMEPRFGHDFSQVRIHTDARASTAARSINALAFTVGNDIAFAPGQYQPGSASGRELLAHELTHTIQQSGGVQRVQRDEAPDASAAPAPGADSSAAPAAPGQPTIEELTGGAISVAGPLVRINGITQTNTLIADSVIASSYTPGAGNVW